MRNFMIRAAAAAAALFVLIGFHTAGINGQVKSGLKLGSKEFCSGNYYSSGDKFPFNEVREFTVPASGRLSVDGGKNGGIAVKGANFSEIQVKACVNAWGSSEEAARAVAGNIRIDTGGTIKAENGTDDTQWSVSYLITVPRSTNLELAAKNGGISIAGVSGDIEFATVNGGISLKDVSGDVRGRTTNGGVNVDLSGTSWIGNGLDVTTTNGGVHLSIPHNYAANIESGTTKCGFKSDIPELNVTTEDVKGDWGSHSRSKQINTSINGGGAPIKLRTTNGGVKISTSDEATL